MLAWDKVKNEHQADAHLTREIGPLIDPVVHALGRDVGAEMDKLESDLRRISVHLAFNLASFGPGNPPAPRRIDAATHITREFFEQALKNLGYHAAGVGVSIAFDAYAIANSRVGADVLKKIAAVSSRVFAKQVIRMAASTVLVLADGPLPIGDILAAVGLLWTAYDISQMQVQFENEIRMSTETRFGEVRSAMKAQVNVFAASKVSEFRELQSKMGSTSVELFTRGTK